MSVNLSARQLQHPGLVDDLAAALATSGFPAELLTLELTESVLMQGGDSAIDALHALKALGVRLALDDFGTGYSSLSYLRNLPVDTVKIDRSFIEGIDAGVGDGLSVLRGIIQLGHEPADLRKVSDREGLVDQRIAKALPLTGTSASYEGGNLLEIVQGLLRQVYWRAHS